LQIHYNASNNGVEYEALIHGLRIAVSLGIKRLLSFGNSKVVIKQVNKDWDCVKDTMDAYCVEIRKLEGHFEGIEFQHVPCNNNIAADVLSKLGSRRALVPAGVFVQDLRKASIKLLDPDNPEQSPNDQNPVPPCDVLMTEKEDDWRKPFIDFILDQLVPDDKTERERITQRSANYVVTGSDLYRKAASTGILMKCILRSEGLQLLAEIHSGECGCHAASTNLVGKAYRSGFYWSTAVTDAKDLVKRCKGCQFFAKQQHLPAQALRTIPPSWPFAIWGLDAVRPFRTVPGGYKHILVAVDKFTKWIEVRPVAKVTSEEANKFIGDIKHRFSVRNRIITDLGAAFTGSVFWDFCQDNLIDVYYSSVTHPRCNGQVERANGMVLQALKDRIYDDASNYATRWLAELPHVIWGLRTQVSSATGFSPFFLVYGSEAILPTDVTFEAPRIQFYEEGEAEQTCRIDLDSLEEQRLTAIMRQARHDQQLRRYHDRNVKETSFNVGDLVLRRIQKTDGMHKLSAPWEGPFIVTEVISPWTYRLQWGDGQGVPNPGTWSIYDDSIRRLVSF
jgi:ribonuclease HI